jgi:hypothetical protein
VRVLLATLIVAGCGFEHAELQAGGSGGSAGDPQPDGSVPATVTCKYADPALRLCVEFEDGNYSTATDGAAYHMHADATDVGRATRGTENAAGTLFYSKLEIGENAMLDITPAITFEAWLAVPSLTGYHNAKLLFNKDQYELSLDDEGKLSCRAGGLTATSANAVGENQWHHVACVFDGASLSVWIDGVAAKCQPGPGTLSTGGSAGTRLVYGFNGFVDDLRIYTRKLTPAEICSHADKTACASTCP